MYAVMFLKEAHVSTAKALRSFSINTLAFDLAFLKYIGPGTAFPVMLKNSLDTVRIEAQLQNATNLKPVTWYVYQP